MRTSSLETTLDFGKHFIARDSLDSTGAEFNEAAFGDPNPFSFDFGNSRVDGLEKGIDNCNPIFNRKR
jgi:hypothetical protein